MKEPFPVIPVKKIDPLVIKDTPFPHMHDYHHNKGMPPHEKRPRF